MTLNHGLVTQTTLSPCFKTSRTYRFCLFRLPELRSDAEEAELQPTHRIYRQYSKLLKVSDEKLTIYSEPTFIVHIPVHTQAY